MVLEDGGDQNEKLLENLTREQTTLGNLAPGQRFSLADQGKSIRTIFAAAGAMPVVLRCIDRYTDVRMGVQGINMWFLYFNHASMR